MTKHSTLDTPNKLSIGSVGHGTRARVRAFPPEKGKIQEMRMKTQKLLVIKMSLFKHNAGEDLPANSLISGACWSLSVHFWTQLFTAFTTNQEVWRKECISFPSDIQLRMIHKYNRACGHRKTPGWVGAIRPDPQHRGLLCFEHT